MTLKLEILLLLITLLAAIHDTECLVPAKFQWKTLDFVWPPEYTRVKAIADGCFVPENNMPTGLARWRDKLFITVPRWKRGVPSSLNYVLLNGPQDQPLRPYPSWPEAFIDLSGRVPRNTTVVSAFRLAVDDRDRLWVVDNGVVDMACGARQIAEPAILVFDLNTDRLVHKFVFRDQLMGASVLTSIVVDNTCGCDNSTFAYITDASSSSVLVYDQLYGAAWRVASPKLQGEGIACAALSPTPSKSDGSRNLYVQPMSGTKTFKISTSILCNRSATDEEKYVGVTVAGDRGANSQATACDVDPVNNIMFLTQLNRNGISCWNMDKPFSTENNPLIISDCNLLEYPNDVKVDKEGNLWMLSDRQSRFLTGRLDFRRVNFRVLVAPVNVLVHGSTCARPSRAASIRNFFRRKKSAS